MSNSPSISIDTLGPVCFDFSQPFEPVLTVRNVGTSSPIRYTVDPSLPAPYDSARLSLHAIRENLQDNMRGRVVFREERDHFRSNRWQAYCMCRILWTSWPKPPPAVQRRLPTHAGYRLAAPPP